MNSYDMLPADRLCDAADAILVSIADLGNHPLSAFPSKLMGHELQPEAFGHFTLTEIEAAEGFLSRCGMLGGTIEDRC